ncbi:hypothetical protein ACFWVC_04080 [Streptomyces sp. NPDC058691]|uniref:hypothetical protein n=1 Tax=Streptomyces sp. NPDC058691 TaxID=3346601 RepID=UPI003664D7F0
MRGNELVGTLAVYGVDMPAYLCDFFPGAGWEPVRPLFEADAEVTGPDPDGSRTAAVLKPIVGLGLVLVPVAGGKPIDRFILRIYGDKARLRY